MSRRLSILIVEDEALVRLAVVDLFTRAGYEVLEARESADAIRILTDRPDVSLIFTDIEMPGKMDGVALANLVRERWPPMRIVVASGKENVRDEELPVGTRFLAKPYRDEAALDTVAVMLG